MEWEYYGKKGKSSDAGLFFIRIRIFTGWWCGLIAIGDGDGSRSRFYTLVLVKNPVEEGKVVVKEWSRKNSGIL